MEGKKIFESIGIAMAVVIMSVIGALIIGTILASSVFNDNLLSGTVTNESLGAVDNITNVTLGIISTRPTATCTLTTVYNASDGIPVVASGNFSFFSSVCNIILEDASPYIGETLNATYDFTYSTGLSSIGINITNIGVQFGAFITGLIAFLAVIGTIVGVVWLVFYVKALFDKKQGIQAITA